VQLKKSDVPEGWTLEGADFVNRVYCEVYSLVDTAQAVKSFRVEWKPGGQNSPMVQGVPLEQTP